MSRDVLKCGSCGGLASLSDSMVFKKPYCKCPGRKEAADYEEALYAKLDIKANPELVGEPFAYDVSVIQRLYGDGRHADGTMRMMRADVGLAAAKAYRERQMLAMAEIDPLTGLINISVMTPDSKQLTAEAENRAGEKAPSIVLKKLIFLVASS